MSVLVHWGDRCKYRMEPTAKRPGICQAIVQPSSTYSAPPRDGPIQDCSISSAFAMEIMQSCAGPSIYKMLQICDASWRRTHGKALKNVMGHTRTSVYDVQFEAKFIQYDMTQWLSYYDALRDQGGSRRDCTLVPYFWPETKCTKTTKSQSHEPIITYVRAVYKSKYEMGKGCRYDHLVSIPHLNLFTRNSHHDV